MKKYIALFAGLAFAGLVSAQSNVSKPMSFHIEKEVIPPRLTIVGTPKFVDQDQNDVIDANEKCYIRFEIRNDGRGDAYNCVAHLSATGTTQGLILRDMPLPIIERNTSRTIEVPINATAGTKTGEIQVSLEIDEPNGYGPDPVSMKIGTHKVKTPFVEVASYKISGNKGGQLKRREEFILQIIVQNTDQGTAENVQLDLNLPENVNWTDGAEKHLTIGTLRPNEKRTYEYSLMANQKAADGTNIEIALSESKGRYSKNAAIPLHFDKYVGSTISLTVARQDEEVEIQKASLLSDVDVDIPSNTGKHNNNTFALIIANEHYSQVAAVPFAINDGQIFREYCIRTLGINKDHIDYRPNATLNEINDGLDWLDMMTHTYVEENPQVIVYYAGHGIPDEADKTSYLLPVDGNGTNVNSGLKLDDLYARLGALPATKVTVFMDACFSGSKREQGMLASARGVALKAKSGIPRGNMVVFSAAQGDETAYPHRDQQHGMFTYFLLKKIQETRGNVDLKTLGDYITKQVSQKSADINKKKQTPCVTPSATVGEEWQTWTLK
jgi:uncharacterized caspase-like protein